jgi:hypothetical protein
MGECFVHEDIGPLKLSPICLMRIGSIQGQKYGKEIRVLFATGSTCTLINPSVLPTGIGTTPKEVQVLTLSGPIKLTQQVTLDELSFPEFSPTHRLDKAFTAIVSPNTVSYDAILGNDFLVPAGFEILAISQTIRWLDRSILWQPHSAPREDVQKITPSAFDQPVGTSELLPVCSMLIRAIQHQECDKQICVRFDSSSSVTRIHPVAIPRGIDTTTKEVQVTTDSGSTKATQEEVTLDKLSFPELSPTRYFQKEVTVIVSRDTGSYDAVVGNDILVPAQIEILASSKTVRWLDLSIPWKPGFMPSEDEDVIEIPPCYFSPPARSELRPLSSMRIGTIQQQKYGQEICVLFEPNSNVTSINPSVLPKGIHTTTKEVQLTASDAGPAEATEEVTLEDLVFPEFGSHIRLTKAITAIVSSDTGSYDAILGNDFLAWAGFEVLPSSQTIQWLDDLSVEWQPIRKRAHYNSFQFH